MFEKLFQKYITPKNVIFFLMLVLTLVFLSMVSDIAIMFFASFVIACSMEPLVKKLSAKVTRAKATAIVLAAGILSLCALIIPIIIIGGNEIKSFADSFPQYLEALKKFVEVTPLLNRLDLVNINVGEFISSASTVSTTLISETVNIGRVIGSGFIYLLLALIIIYYFSVDKEIVKATFLKLFPKPLRKRTNEIYETISLKMGGYVISQIATMASVGIIVTIGLLILRVDYALLLGLITSVFDLVPVVGPAIAFLICMIAVYKYGPLVLILTAVIFAFAQLVENNFVRPYVFGKLLNIHPLIIYMFLFIAAKYLGILGVVFAPALAALFVVLVEEIYMKSID